ncbi:MAG: HEAT repeat domain-containing protein [Symploca sp. SIO1A3]|nr:HEAT repeat domain-containing protein [Symploca sp. SIO2C1]NER50671.1 HEAT repeat domain-containing protein [Symploca sp. SIO1A3]
MDIHQIEAALNSPNSNDRLKALTELRNYSSEVAVPLLTSKLQDPEFVVRSFVAMGLGKKRTEASFSALLELMRLDRDPNVRAEAANSLSLFGQVAASHLVQAFQRDKHWLLRRSILAALMDMEYPEALFDVCICALVGEEPTVKEAAIDGLSFLAGSPKHTDALQQLLALTDSEWWRIRWRVARALRRFDEPKARDALNRLKQDEDHRVVGAALESLL